MIETSKHRHIRHLSAMPTTLRPCCHPTSPATGGPVHAWRSKRRSKSLCDSAATRCCAWFDCFRWGSTCGIWIFNFGIIRIWKVGTCLRKCIFTYPTLYPVWCIYRFCMLYIAVWSIRVLRHSIHESIDSYIAKVSQIHIHFFAQDLAAGKWERTR